MWILAAAAEEESCASRAEDPEVPRPRMVGAVRKDGGSEGPISCSPSSSSLCSSSPLSSGNGEGGVVGVDALEKGVVVPETVDEASSVWR